MSLSLDLSTALNPLVGQTFVPPKTCAVSDGRGITLAVDLISVESLGVSCEELRLDVPSLGAGQPCSAKTRYSDRKPNADFYPSSFFLQNVPDDSRCESHLHKGTRSGVLQRSQRVYVAEHGAVGIFICHR